MSWPLNDMKYYIRGYRLSEGNIRAMLLRLHLQCLCLPVDPGIYSQIYNQGPWSA